MIYVILLIIHYISDFVFQTRDMGNNKSKSNAWLTVHVVVYSISFLLIFTLISSFFIQTSLFLIGVYILFNGTLHWITDYITSRLTSKYYLQKKEKAFWNIIGLDQLIHTSILILSYNFIFL